MKCPHTLAQLNNELRRRHVSGLSMRVVDCNGEVLRDDRVGLLLRVIFVMDDGDTFQMDTNEVAEFLRAAERH